MSDLPCDKFSEWDGAYVLGALSPEERHEYEAHLGDCPRCSIAVRQLAGLPGLLARIPAADALAEPDSDLALQPPPTLLPGLLDEVARQRRRTRWRLAAAVGAAAAALVAVAVLAFGALVPSTPRAVPMAVVTSTPIEATAAVVDKPWGTEVDLRCTYGTGATTYGPASYELVAVDRSGDQHTMASWTVVPNKESTVTGATALHTSQISALEVRTPGDQPVLRLALH